MNRVMIPQLWGTEYRVLETRALLSRTRLKSTPSLVIARSEATKQSPRSPLSFPRTREFGPRFRGDDPTSPFGLRIRPAGRPEPSEGSRGWLRLTLNGVADLRSKYKLWFSSFLVLLIATLGLFAFPNTAWADPHATFFTDRAQEQLFFNVLAALNQADYVEPPDTPPLESDRRLGRFFRTGISEPPPNPRTVIRDQFGNPQQVIPAPEPSEQAGVELPRIRVRQVTSDDGDVFYRERVERRALAEEMRVLIAQLACRDAETIFGPTAARATDFCRPRPDTLPLPPAP